MSLILCAWLASTVASAAPDAPALAVLPVVTRPELAEAATLLAGSLTERLGALGTWRVIASDEIAELMRNEADRQGAGCSDAACLTELAGALGARFVVTGELARVDHALVWSAALVDQTEGDVKVRAQKTGASVQALSVQVEEMAYALMGRANEASLDGEGAPERYGFTSAKDFQAFRDHRAAHPERSTSELLTQFIIDHNIESDRLAVVEAALFVAAGLVPAMLAVLGPLGLLALLGLQNVPLAAAILLPTVVLPVMGIGLLAAAAALVAVDALNVGRIDVRAHGCCRNDDVITGARERTGMRRAAGMMVALSGSSGLVAYIVLTAPISAAQTLLAASGAAPYAATKAVVMHPAFVPLSSLASFAFVTAFFGGFITIAVSLVAGAFLLLWPDPSVVTAEPE